MDLDDLRCFEYAAGALHFRAAAARMHLSASAFSERIRRLERDVGVPLFERTTRRVELTPAGRQLLPHARATLRAAEGLSAAATHARTHWEVTIGTRYELGLSWLVPALDTLSVTCPERKVHLWVGDGPSCVDAVRQGRIDATVLSLRAQPEDLSSLPIHAESYRFVGAAGTRFATPEDARRHTLIDALPNLPLFRYLLDAVGGPPWAFKEQEYMGGIGAIRARILAGRGVGVLPAYFVREDLEQGRLIALLPAVELQADTFRLSWLRGHPRTAELARLAEELRDIPLR